MQITHSHRRNSWCLKILRKCLIFRVWSKKWRTKSSPGCRWISWCFDMRIRRCQIIDQEMTFRIHKIIKMWRNQKVLENSNTSNPAASSVFILWAMSFRWILTNRRHYNYCNHFNRFSHFSRNSFSPFAFATVMLFYLLGKLHQSWLLWNLLRR